MAARTTKLNVKRRSAEARSAARPAKTPQKGAGGKSGRTALAPAASAKAKPKPAKIGRSTAGKSPVERTVQYRQAGGWEVIDVADGIAVHDGAFNSVHYLNHTAAIVFLLCAEPIGFDVLCTVFREEFGLKTAPRAELRKIIAQMEASGLLSAVNTGVAKAPGARPKR